MLLERPLDTPVAATEAERICRDFGYDESLADIGARLLREAQWRSHRAAADGGATVTILLEGLLRGGARQLAAGVEPQALARGLRQAALAVDRRLAEETRLPRGRRERAALAHAIAKEPSVGVLLAKASAAVGDHGALLVEPWPKAAHALVAEPGIRLPRGLVSPLLATDTLRLTTTQRQPAIFLSARPLRQAADVVPLLEHARRRSLSLLVIAEAVEDGALATLTTNRIRGLSDVAAICAPTHGDARRDQLEDVAAATGARVVDRLVDAASGDCLGRAEEAVAGMKATLIRGPRHDPPRVRQRLREIDAATEAAHSDYEREQLYRRRANLSGRTAILRIGGVTDPEHSAALQRAETAVRAYTLALRGGVLPGGGKAYVRAAAAATACTLSGDERRGAELLARVLRLPARQLLINAGLDSPAIAAIVAAYASTANEAMFDVETARWRRGVVLDSAHALRTALQIAVSLAASLLTASVVIAHPTEMTYERPM